MEGAEGLKATSVISAPQIQCQMAEEVEEEELIQPKNDTQSNISIGTGDDPLEREADRVAEQVMRLPDGGHSVGVKPSLSIAKLGCSPPVSATSESALIRMVVSITPGIAKSVS
jgi:hypothetical protein